MPDPLLAGLAWHVADPLDLRAMAPAADALLGEHDFRAFCRRAPGTSAAEPIDRRVSTPGGSSWPARARRRSEPGRDPGRPGPPAGALVPGRRLLAFEIEANSFCHQMVRSLVGTLVDVGRGRSQPSDVTVDPALGRPAQAAQPAPAHGLTLMAVRYGG